MLTSGDVVRLDLGVPEGSEAGFERPAVVVTAQVVLDQDPVVVHIVPVTSNLRHWDSDVEVLADDGNGLTVDSAIQCHHIRAIARSRLGPTVGNVGPVTLAQARQHLSRLLDI